MRSEAPPFQPRAKSGDYRQPESDFKLSKSFSGIYLNKNIRDPLKNN
jgi:hypothetical protein